MTEFQLGLQLMGYGLAGVFISLILFYVLVKVLVKLGNRKKKPSGTENRV